MIYNYIAMGLAGAFLLLSLVSVITEPLLNRDKSAGRAFRKLRINLREVGSLPFLFITFIGLLIGKIVHGTGFISREMILVWIAAGVFILGLVILHGYRIFRSLHSRRYARRSVPLTPLRTAGLLREAAELKEAAPARELMPLEPAVVEVAEEELRPAE